MSVHVTSNVILIGIAGDEIEDGSRVRGIY